MELSLGTGPVATAEAALAADRYHGDPALWITRRPDAAILAVAKALEVEGRRGRPLWGVPFAVKDNIDVAGLPTTAACPGFATTPEHSAPCVQSLLDAGAVLLGKTNLDQFATGLAGVRSPYGTPRNVFDAARVPGGSSSGSACAVAAGIAQFALGTDTAGSGRVPAMFGNVVGLKPTIGSVSARGMVPACRSIDTVSVFARSVDEALAVARVIAGYDPADPYARTPPLPHLRRGAHGPARLASVDAGMCVPEQARRYLAAAAALGAEVVDIAPLLAIARLLYEGPWVAERAAALRQVLRTPDILHPVTRTILESGLGRSAVDAFDAFHQLAAARRFAAELFAQYDALLLPTAPDTPTLAAVEADPIGVIGRLGTWTNFVNLCDLAAWAVPAGLGGDGLPAGLTVVGPAWSEGRLAALADGIHRSATGQVGATGQALPPRAAPDPLAPDEMALFCVGGHMAGLPLNHQVTVLGGRLVGEARTGPGYRLYDLGGRPGMVAHPAGVAIAGEIWALPTNAIGTLLSQVPPPLGFGTVQLDSGPCLGFLAEAASCAEAPEITPHGGWRAYLAAGAAAEAIAARPDAADEWVGVAARAMQLPIAPAWRADVATNLRTLLDAGSALTEPALPDLLEPAPVFRA